MRTFNANYLDAQARGERRTSLVAITDGVTTWKAVSGKSAVVDAPAAVASVSDVSAEVSLPERKLQIGSIELIVEDAWLRLFYPTNRLVGKKVTVYTGFESLAEADYEEHGVGAIPVEGVSAIDGTHVKIEVWSAWEILAHAEIVGAWIQMHPLEIMEDIILNKAGLPAAFLNATEFDPDDAANAAFSHFVVHRSKMQNYANDTTIWQPTSALELVNELAQMMDGTVRMDELGVIRFKPFDSSASSVRSLTADTGLKDVVIRSPEHRIVNQVEIEYNPAVPESGTIGKNFDGRYVDKDTASQAAYKLPGMTARAITHRLSTAWISSLGYLDLFGGISSGDTTFNITGPRIGNICGSRGAYPTPGSQPAAAKIGASRPLYLLTDAGEIIKATTLTVVGNTPMMIPQADPSDFTVAFHPLYADYEVSGVSRAQFGTSAAAATTAVDITIPVFMANKILERHAFGVQLAEIVCDMLHNDLEVTDIVDLTWPKYLGYGLDGLTSSTKWEILGKTPDPTGSNQVKFLIATIAAAVVTSSKLAGFGAAGKFFGVGSVVEAMQNNEGFANFVQTGLDVTGTGGLGVSVSVGRGSAGLAGSTLPAPAGRDLTASRDVYVSQDVETGAIIFKEQTLGSAPPGYVPGEVNLGKVTTDGTGVTAVDKTQVVNHAFNVAATAAPVQPKTGSVFNGGFSRATRG